MTEKDKELIELRKEIRMLKILYCKCQDCANADLYVPHYTIYGGVYTSPRCKITGKEITPTQNACEDFTRIGRNSR